ncbi:hypothetical protein BAUCODRAFT_283864 [Baudoinia panamericana UAMH 10762]|uniref:BTB domain-containing protein n=1 Tax=Baudoinia panamericana (strain UAMH 10762) TaxID=717646 RepID=M2MLJ5_BAUPA|nr:uncharacterized protein BAUCODRAFT_283864 [Baudoinia panamericana UAMH 10762]EMC92268.1 hypothetical protein BAUCODRAFT_283864 [Baudoinia panamericana UAMH 10762]
MVASRNARDSPSSRNFKSSAVLGNGAEEVHDDGTEVFTLVADGDVVLHFQHEANGVQSSAAFRVSTTELKSRSRYFDRLFGRFGEAAKVEARHKTLGQQYRTMADVPSAQLPMIVIEDLGRISGVKSPAILLRDFLRILHSQEIESNLPVANLANLSIVADRFDALEWLKVYFSRKKAMQAIDSKMTPKADNGLSEEKVRQRLLVGYMLDFPKWIEKHSARLIMKGWVGQEPDISAALWWDLPGRMEEELAFRRECVLETIQSLQTYLLGLYTSRERQCKLGYDSSAQCDSFQLGEMIRFFARIGTLRLQGAILETDEPHPQYDGDIQNLVDLLRQVPEYQIDRNHTHCGLRTRIMPLLDMIRDCCFYVGVCPDCWHADRAQYAWIESKRPLLWKRQSFSLRAYLSRGHGSRHAELRDMFLATERDWS